MSDHSSEHSSDHPDPITLKGRLARAAELHVPFDGFSDAALAAAADDIGVPLAHAKALCPRGGVDLAAELHRLGDAAMMDAVPEAGLDEMRYSDRVAALIRIRLDCAGDREVVRRATALFALPIHGIEGAQLIWGTADAIWRALGDHSRDVNWYTKRAILSGVYGSCVLYWLGDKSEGFTDTDAFIARRIADVMRFEKTKAKLRESPVLSPLMQGLGRLAAGIRAPSGDHRSHLPGTLKPKET